MNIHLIQLRILIPSSLVNVYKANDAMISIKYDAIKKQSRRFWKRFQQLMVFHESMLEKPPKP